MFLSGVFNGHDRVWGIVGYNKGIVDTKIGECGVVNCCYNQERVLGCTRVGGIVGYAHEAKIVKCMDNGKVLGYTKIGGIIGSYNNSTSKI